MAYNAAINRIQYFMYKNRSQGFTTKQESQKRDSYFSSANARREQTLSSGFTLIELLVVIAIIGILSAGVLASLNTARSKGNDAAIQSDLATIQTQAEISYGDSNNSYANVCTDPTIVKAIAGATSASAGTVVCNPSATAYAVSSPLSTGGAWCVDSTGVARKATAANVAYTGTTSGTSPALGTGATVCN